MTNTSKGTALITGASTGIGAIYARRLAERGYDLILVARDAGKLNVLAAEVVKATGKHVEVQAADLTDAVALSKVEDVLRSNARITLLLNNAGVGATAPLLASDISAMEQMIRLNVLAPTGSPMRPPRASCSAAVERSSTSLRSLRWHRSS